MNRLKLGAMLIVLLVITSSCAQKNSACSNKCKDSCSIECQDKNDTTNNNEEIKMMENTNSYNPSGVLVCKLIGSELAEQKELLKKEIFSQVQGIDEVDNGYILKFEDKNDILLKLTDYLMIEKECCPFFDFHLNIQPNSKSISLKISGQEGVKDMLKPVIEEIRDIN